MITNGQERTDVKKETGVANETKQGSDKLALPLGVSTLDLAMLPMPVAVPNAWIPNGSSFNGG